MKAAETAFSAKSRRSKFGIINAVVKASAYIEVPRKAAFVISRSSPIILDINVINERSNPDFKSDLLFDCAFSLLIPTMIKKLQKMFNSFIIKELQNRQIPYFCFILKCIGWG